MSKSGSSNPQPEKDELGRLRVASVAPGYAELHPLHEKETRLAVSLLQHMGDRRTQEDRFMLVPTLTPSTAAPVAVFAVFDGTVGDFASDNIKEIFMQTLLEQESWQRLNAPSCSQSDRDNLLYHAARDTFIISDRKLLERCSRNQQHYATSTGVAVIVAYDRIVVAHIGDSRIVTGTEEGVAEQVTHDHKPDQDHERKRIEECGGMVERLINHNNKPFIRGGDFMMRKALGEQPMQLQYSRAFGGKDLKIFGLSSRPDVRVIPKRGVRWIILASDGLWDVITHDTAVALADRAHKGGNNPSAELVRAALLEQSKRKARADNITVVVVKLDSE